MLSEEQRRNYDFFREHLPEYLKDPVKKHKFAIFADCALQGVSDTFAGALQAACEKFRLGDFVIQQIIDPKEAVETPVYSA